MKYQMKVNSLLFVISLFILSLILGCSTNEIKTTTPPKINIKTTSGQQINAIIGSYSWTSAGENVIACSDHPTAFIYRPENIISTNSGEQLFVEISDKKLANWDTVNIEELTVYKNDKLIDLELPNEDYFGESFNLTTPIETGEYVYSLTIKFGENNSATYGFKVKVNMLTYNWDTILQFKTPYIGDAGKVSQLVSSLPVPIASYNQRYISMQTSERPYSLTVYYEKQENDKDDPVLQDDLNSIPLQRNLEANAFVLFTLIDNLDTVIVTFRDTPSNGFLEESHYTEIGKFQKDTFVQKYGALTRLSENIDSIEQIIKKIVSNN